MEIDYSDKIEYHKNRADELEHLEDVSNFIIRNLDFNGIHHEIVGPYLTSVVILLQKPWVKFDEFMAFEQDVEKILQILNTAELYRETSSGMFSGEPIYIGYDFSPDLGVEFTTEEIQEFYTTFKGVTPHKLTVDLAIGTNHRMHQPHIRRICINIGDKRNVGETGFGIRKYKNKIKKHASKNENLRR